ncbi:beta-galactosidase [Alteribacter keqinensis]|uniref:Beta-galactosidase n=1 Tax=Alteribacter keqinensis TaxID=2483800 RepID=A0A3M7TUP4_9BACI|nr:beta-galactosidase [Alteribacter keqinensis]RNA68434.1 beta-galactosidase [Alteribacter keqinensis]
MQVKMENQKFVINGEDVFLYGGELHYFRVPKDEWKDRLIKIKESGCNLVSTYVPWVWHEPREGEVDLTGGTRGERDLKGFLALVREMGLYCIVRPGPYVMAEVRYHGIPAWLLDNYPEVVAKNREGKEHPTSVVSYRHPVFLEKTKKWYEAVNEVIAPQQIEYGGPVIMYQLCNEIGMFHWVTNTSDFNEEVLDKFTDYLSGQYGTIESFNQKYNINEASFSDFVSVFKEGLPSEYPSFHFEWSEFRRVYIRDYVGDLRSFAKDTGITVPFIINVHGFKDYSIYSRGVDYPIGLSQLYLTSEFNDVVIAGDFYPGHIGYDNYHDLVLATTFTRAISRKNQPVFSAEFQSGRLADRPRLYPQDLDLNTRTCVAHGMNALNYYMFAGGENYENIGLFGRRHEWQAPIDSKGNLRPNYEKARHLGEMFRTIGSRLLDSTKKVHTYVGFNPDDYMTEVVDKRDEAFIGDIVGKREQASFDGVLRLLTAANIHFEAVNLKAKLNPVNIPSLWVFSTAIMKEKLQRNLSEYVKEGGKLVLYPEIPYKDENGNLCRLLADELELGTWEVIGGRPDYADVMSMDAVNIRQRLHFQSFDGKPLARFSRTGNEEVAAYVKQYEKGEILVLGLTMGHDYAYQLDVIKELAETLGIKGHLHAENENISLVERSNGRESFLFVSNYDEVEQGTVIYEEGRPALDGEEIILPPRSSVMVIRDYEIAKGLSVVFSTLEWTKLEQTEDQVTFTLNPVGRGGMVKLKTDGQWNTEHNEATDADTIKIKSADKPVTIVLKKQSL